MARSARLPLSLWLTLAGALCALATAAPAALAAKAERGVVLSAAHGTARLVDAHHRVIDAHVRSAHGLKRGAEVTVSHGSAQVTGHARTVSFYGRVVRSSAHGALLRLADGSTFKLGAGHAHSARAASTVTVNVQGLAPGQAVLITIASDGQGNVALTIKLVSGATSIGDGEQDATGVVTDDTGDGQFAIRTADGSGLRFSDPQRLLEAAQASQCDEVDVTYHARHHKLVADTLRVTGTSDQGACAGGSQQQGGGGEVDGSVTAIAPDDSSIAVDPGDGSGPQTIPVPDASLLAGVNIGDQVAVMTDGDGNATEIDVLDTSGDGSGDGGQQPGDTPDGGGDS